MAQGDAEKENDRSGSGEPISWLRAIRAYWHVLATLVGVSTFVAAILLWMGPLTLWHRRQALALFATAKEQASEGRWYEANQLLETLIPNLWRIDEKSGEALFLMGVANNELADKARPSESRAYRRRALPCLREAAVRGVPEGLQLDLDEELGRSLYNAGYYSESIPVLEEVLVVRRQLQGVILRRLTEATAHQEPVDETRLRVLLERWSKIPTLPLGDKETIASAKKLLDENQIQLLRDLLSSEEPSWNGGATSTAVFVVDLRAELALSLGHVDVALEMLQREQAANNEELSSVLARLMNARLSQDPPNHREALANGAERISLEGLSAVELDQARRRQAEALLAMNRPRDARAFLNEISPSDGANGVVHFLLGQSYFDEGLSWDDLTLEAWRKSNPRLKEYSDWLERVQQSWSVGDPRETRVNAWRNGVAGWLSPTTFKTMVADAHFFAACKHFSAALADPNIAEESYYGRSLIGLGVSETLLRQYASAEKTLERLINGFPGSDFERAALFYRADNLSRSGNPQAVEAFEEANEATKGRLPFDNRYLALNRLRTLFTRAWEKFQQSGDYTNGMAVARIYRNYSPPGVADQMLGDSARALAERLSRRAKSERYADSEATLRESWKHFELAGDSYYRAAMADRSSNQYADLLWQAALNTFDAHYYDRAAELFHEFGEAHGTGEREFLTRYLISRCAMASEDFARARELLEEVLARRPRSPNRFEARVDLAECYVELAEALGPEPKDAEGKAKRTEYLSRADALLAENIDGLNFDLEPKALEWQRSLFVLGRLLHEQGRYPQAIERLREASRRYPDASQVLDSKYRIADSYRRWAEASQTLMQDPGVTPRGRTVLQNERNDRLKSALQEFEDLRSKLLKVQEERPLSPDEQALLRGSFFSVGDVYVALEDWEGAIDAYTTAANRFQDRPECLSAYVQIANAYLRLGRSSEANSTLRQARWVLSKLDDRQFAGSAMNKNQWKSRLDSLVGDL
ncbi:MAG: tetratricopeptide repeat protein [Planctomycetota bacterium]